MSRRPAYFLINATLCNQSDEARCNDTATSLLPLRASTHVRGCLTCDVKVAGTRATRKAISNICEASLATTCDNLRQLAPSSVRWTAESSITSLSILRNYRMNSIYVGIKSLLSEYTKKHRYILGWFRFLVIHNAILVYSNVYCIL